MSSTDSGNRLTNKVGGGDGGKRLLGFTPGARALSLLLRAEKANVRGEGGERETKSPGVTACLRDQSEGEARRDWKARGETAGASGARRRGWEGGD